MKEETQGDSNEIVSEGKFISLSKKRKINDMWHTMQVEDRKFVDAIMQRRVVKVIPSGEIGTSAKVKKVN